MKRNYSFLVMLLTLLFITTTGFESCNGDETADEKDKKKTQQAMQEANAEVGMPAINNWYEKKMMKSLFELRDQSNLVCYAYIWSDYNGKFIYLGECIGYGLPYSVQYTNPEYIADRYGEGYAILPQPDPNGLFMPEGLSATWLNLIDEKTGKASPLYMEPEIAVFQHKLPARIVIGY